MRLAVGDLEVRASFALSYQGLKPVLQRAFRLLGAVRASDFAPWVLSALLDVSLTEAEDLLESLVDAQLVEVNVADHVRYRLHDLVRVYARERLNADEPDVEQRAAVERFLGACLWLAEQAGEHPSSRVCGSMHGSAQRWPMAAAATGLFNENLARWIEAEQDVLAGAVEVASAADLPEFTWDLAGSIAGLFAQIGCTAKWEHTLNEARTAVHRVHDLRGEAVLLFARSQLASYCDDPVESEISLREAAALFEQIGDRDGTAIVQSANAVLMLVFGRHSEAERKLLVALDLLDDFSDPRICVYVLRALGTTCLYQDKISEARAWFEKALDIANRTGFLFGLGYLKCWLARIHLRSGGHVEAFVLSSQALSVFRRIDHRIGQAVALQDFGECHLRMGHQEEARAAFEQALTIYDITADLSGQAQALTAMGHLELSAGDFSRAAMRFGEAVEVSRQTKRPVLVAYALSGLGDAYEATGNLVRACEARLESLELFNQTGLPVPEHLTEAIGGQGQLTHSSVPSANT